MTDRPARSDGATLPVQYTERITMNNNTLNALILRHGDNLLRRSGWPENVGVVQIAPQDVPGWLSVCGVLSADEILTLTTRLCQTQNAGQAHLLTASATAGWHARPAASVPGSDLSLARSPA